MRKLPVIPLLVLLSASACASNSSGSLSAAERADCKAKGGTIQRVGMSGTSACVIPYVDAGKTCSNDRDCLGRCLTAMDGGPPPEVGQPASGTCEPTNATFGCFAEVDDGKAKPALCVD